MPCRAYLGRFNFKGNDQQKLVGNLSGGERGRLHLAKTLIAGGNVLMLDEPSNDLDVETLRALEDALLEFAGSIMVISHDRWFLDRIATHILAAEGDSKWVFFDGNYQEYEADKKKRLGEEGAKPKRLRFRPISTDEGRRRGPDRDFCQFREPFRRRTIERAVPALARARAFMHVDPHALAPSPAALGRCSSSAAAALGRLHDASRPSSPARRGAAGRRGRRRRRRRRSLRSARAARRPGLRPPGAPAASPAAPGGAAPVRRRRQGRQAQRRLARRLAEGRQGLAGAASPSDLNRPFFLSPQAQDRHRRAHASSAA